MGYIVAGAWMAGFHGLVLAAIAVLALWGGLCHNGLVSKDAHGASDRGVGIVLHRAAAYDMLARVLTFGREGRFREFMLRLAKLQPGEAVLDVACGTGTLAIAAKRRVGSGGSVTGIDASTEMIERARAKARRSGLDLTFVKGTAQELPFEDGQFDIVTGTLMLHHLSKPTRSAFFREVERVLKPGGRLLLIDFSRPVRKSRLPRLHRHGHSDMNVVGKLLAESGFKISDSGAVGTKKLNYISAVTNKEPGGHESR
ncbi:class I SAM-dependent methyltransferase [Mesorhizobium captivum]|uniref:class I SAM-dependent methyltransferase n=1 Tax=Mesorhizobium captivum TaxID=3072319 RepID=UPI002A23AE7D|nr:class I SAM-dependent methyltransferase [Mesorhizobium sp. VK23E]MDX8512695.1 class I SAM-dependent methyltransferase [Mesorhizobium sp. VK23E]